MNIAFVQLADVKKNEVILLMNHPLVQRHMPLAPAQFGEVEYKKFIESKEALWNQNGYGPWAFLANDEFAGWGGLQPEGDDVEIALVLHPKYWGIGKTIYEKIVRHAFEGLKLESIIALFPPSRKHIEGLLRMGFKRDGEVHLDGKLFHRFRLFSI